MQAKMLSRIHESHQGIVKSKQHAQSVLFWPDMNSQIEEIVSQCATCAQFRKAHPTEPLISHEIPDKPLSKIATDLYHLNRPQYLVLVNYYSKFPEVILLNSTKAGPVLAAMKSIFARQGIPDNVISDNGPPSDRAAFASFARSWEFEHSTSSPGFPQSNGQIEHCIQTVKKPLKKAELAREYPFLAYRNTPLDGTDGYSPAEMLRSRLLRLRVRSRVPTAASLLKPHVIPPLQKNLQLRQAKEKFYHVRKSGKELTSLQSGDPVRFINPRGKWEFVKIKEEWNTPRNYVVETPDGRSFCRNRRHMFLTKEQVPSANVTVSPPVIPSSCESSDSLTTQETPRENVNPPGSNIIWTRSERTVKPSEYFGYETQ